MSIVQNKLLPMLESRRYAVRHSLCLCSSCQELYHSVDFRAISKPIMDIFLQILDENWHDDTLGRLDVPVRPKVYRDTIFI